LIPFVLIQIGTAAVPPLFLLAVVHGIAVSVRAGASGTVYRCAVTATAVIGVGAFVLSFCALRDLLTQMGTPPAWAWLFSAVVDTAVGWRQAAVARRSTLPPKHLGLTTGLRSG